MGEAWEVPPLPVGGAVCKGWGLQSKEWGLWGADHLRWLP